MGEHPNDGGPAFASLTHTPMGDLHGHEGMSLRDYTAIHMMPTLYAEYVRQALEGKILPPDVTPKDYIAGKALGFADAMLAARQKGSGQ